MVSYLYAAPSGVPGDITRVDQSNVEPAFLVAPLPGNFGLPMKYAQGPGAGGSVGTGVTPMVAGDTAAVFAGVLTRAVPGISGVSTNEVVDQFTPNSQEVNGLCVKGYVSVVCNFGTPQRGQPVYVCIAPATGHVVGGFDATFVSGVNVPLTGTEIGNVTWASDGKDPFNNAEIRIAQ